MRLPIPKDACAKARELIAGGLAPTERLEFYRGDKLCLHGTAQAFASRMVAETPNGPRHVRYQAFNYAALSRLGKAPVRRTRRPARLIVQE